MLARIRPRRPDREFLKRRHRFRRNQLTLGWLRSAADRIGQHFQGKIGIRTDIDRGRQQAAAHPRLAGLRQAVATRERYLQPALALAFRDFRKRFSGARRHAVVLCAHQVIAHFLGSAHPPPRAAAAKPALLSPIGPHRLYLTLAHPPPTPPIASPSHPPPPPHPL